ncbi:MAG: HIT family protein [Methanobacteriaceae archaeon]
MSSCEYCQLEGGYGDLMWETACWLVFLAPSQRYLGTCVVALKRGCKDLSEVEREEWTDFGLIVKKLEETLKNMFNPTLFNWSCFKNATFRQSNPQPEVHWHFIPRYKEEVVFKGVKFKDPDFGYIPQPITRRIPPEVLKDLKNKIESYLLNNTLPKIKDNKIQE